MKRFVLGTNRTTQEQDAAFFKILRARWPHIGWWHQLGETWLFIDLTDTLRATDLRDAAKEAFPGIYLMVVEAKGPRNWAGYGTTAPPSEMFTWMHKEWDRDG